MNAVDTVAFRRLVEQRGSVVMTDALALQLRGHVRDSATAAAVQAAGLQQALDLRHLTAMAVETELGPAVLLRDVERVLTGGAS